MHARDTPSPGLERAARYVAEQFQALGLEPVGDDSAWVQRYPLPRRGTLDAAQFLCWFLTRVKKGGRPVLKETGRPAGNSLLLRFGDAVLVASDTLLEFRAPGARGGGQASLTMTDANDLVYSGPAPVLVAGPHTAASARQAGLRDRVVVYVPPPGADSAAQRPVLDVLRATNHVLIVADEDSATWAARRRAAAARPPVVLEWYLPEAATPHHWAIYVRARVLAGALATAGVELAAAQTAAAPLVREFDAGVMLGARIAETPRDAPAPTAATAPNVIGVLRGREAGPALVLTAHMDQAAPSGGAAGADDNVGGVAGLLALARAFAAEARAGVRPRRALVFAAVSGGAATRNGSKEFWGSNALLEHWGQYLGRFGADLSEVALNINLDALGGGRDTVYVDGLEDFEFPVPPTWLAAQQPELRLAVVDGGSVAAPTSDHFAFVQRVIPSLYVHGTPHDTVPSATLGTADDTAPDTAVGAAAGAAPLVRRLRFALLLTRELAEATRLPRWTAVGREHRSRVFGR